MKVERTEGGRSRAAAVEALSEAGRARGILNEAVPEFRSGAWRLLDYEVLEARQKFGRSIMLSRISYEEKDSGRIARAQMGVKLYGRRSDGALPGLRRLWEAGFAPPGEFRVPRPFGYSSEYHALFQGWVSGKSWAAVLREDSDEAAREASARAASWLLELQDSAVKGGAPDDAGAVLGGRARELVSEASRFGAAYAARVEEAGRALSGVLSADGPVEVPSHGDYHPENVLLEGGATTVIDLDDFGRREAAYDVGYAVGQLLIMSRLRMGGFGPGAEAALAFWRRYEEGGRARWPRVAAHAARTFLQSLHYELCVLNNGRGELLDGWLGMTEMFLNSRGPETLEDPICHS